jgi:hypothetical protein
VVVFTYAHVVEADNEQDALDQARDLPLGQPNEDITLVREGPEDGYDNDERETSDGERRQ